MILQFHPLDSDFVAAIRAGGPDACGNPAEYAESDGAGSPCRHCLRPIPTGAGMLILAARPFPSLQTCAETGPIFLCAEDCVLWQGNEVPEIAIKAADCLLKGYNGEHRIVYGSGKVVPAGEVSAFAAELLRDPRIACVDLRSARNNCFQTRITEVP